MKKKSDILQKEDQSFWYTVDLPHPVPFNLFDPFGLSKRASDEKKAHGLEIEINNSRIVMLGIFGFLVESTLPGSVPTLSEIVQPYAEEVMSPFTHNMLAPVTF